MWTRDFLLFFSARTVSMLPVATALGMHGAGSVLALVGCAVMLAVRPIRSLARATA